jgi:UDP-N-acetylmuramoylalanine--D-glutamate ligase
VSASGRPQPPAGPYLVLGLARSGAAAALALAARGERVLGVDADAPEGLAELRAAGVEVHANERDGERLLEGVRTLVKSPGVPGEVPLVRAARDRGVEVVGELELAWRMLPNELIAVTGTNGKTTTVELIAHIHRAAGLPVSLAGNVGTALSSLIGAIDSAATVVCEVSSFQLEDATAFAPRAAVLLNLGSDHLDRHGTLEAYEAAKLKIFAAQSELDLAVLPQALSVRVAASLPAPAPALVLFGDDEQSRMRRHGGELQWDEEQLLSVEDLRLRGEHNVQNAMAAAAVCLARGVDRDAVRAGLRSFSGVAHRLEEVAQRDGVLYVNDSKATNVASTVVALEAFAGQPVRLILGGQGKGQDFAALREPVSRRCTGAYLIGEDAPKIAPALAGGQLDVRVCGDLEHALAAAERDARAGEVVMLSPACASFDQFRDFEDRGDRFRELARVGGLTGTASK